MARKKGILYCYWLSALALEHAIGKGSSVEEMERNEHTVCAVVNCWGKICKYHERRINRFVYN
jgi:hypothetical protein